MHGVVPKPGHLSLVDCGLDGGPEQRFFFLAMAWTRVIGSWHTNIWSRMDFHVILQG